MCTRQKVRALKHAAEQGCCDGNEKRKAAGMLFERGVCLHSRADPPQQDEERYTVYGIISTSKVEGQAKSI